MNILGLSTFADSSAAIVKDGNIVCAIEEERLNRIKHYEGMPWLSIDEILRVADMSLGDIDIIAVGWNPFLGWETRIAETIKSLFRMPQALRGKISRGDSYIKGCREILSLRKSLKKMFPYIEIGQRIKFVEHHYAHAASTFLTSSYEQADIMVADGIGESAATSFFKGKGTDIKRIAGIKFPHSLGHIYASVTGFLGFRMTYDEGKVMALASYGDDKYRELFSRLVRINSTQKTIEVNTGLLDYHAARNGVFSKKWLESTGLSPRKINEPLTQQHKNLACSLQQCIEESVFALLRMYFGNSGKNSLCAAGGLFLNSVLNGKIVRDYTDKFFVQPASGDNGVSVGAALRVGSKIDRDFHRHHLISASLGKRFRDYELLDAFTRHSITPRLSNDVFSDTADLIVKGKIVGWFRRGMEFGPRALGNRSIFACPTYTWIKDAVNHKVKHREGFRPFAGTIILEETYEYFEDVEESPFMLKVFYFKNKYKNTFPAITHTDFSCRIQTVSRNQNLDLYSLLREVKKRIGYGIILNTSLNMSNKPIVNTPSEAIELIRNTDLDIMILENYIIRKEDIVNSS
jgi:carbamoyltransferase